MIICVCKNLNGAKIESAIAAGADSPARVFIACGSPVTKENAGCLKCVPEIRQLIPGKTIPIKPEDPSL